MMRGIGWLLSGVLVGALTMFVALRVAPSSLESPGEVVGIEAETVVNPGQAAIASESIESAEADFDEALSELQRLSSPFAKRAAALAMVEAFIGDTGTIDRIASVLPDADAVSFRIDALAILAEYDPARALDGALSLESATAKRLAVERVAAASVASDPEAALAMSNRIADEDLRSALYTSALTAWARLDPTAAIAIATSADSITPAPEDFAVLETIADRVPEELLAAADEFSSALQRSVRVIALGAWGEQDPAAALAFFESARDQGERDALLRGVAANYARSDPATALDRVLAVAPSSRAGAVSVLNEIAQVDFDRAIAIALEAPLINNYSTVAALPLGAHLDRVPAFADRLVLQGASHASALQLLTTEWAREDPIEALNWALQNRAALDDLAFRGIANETARRNGVEAASMLDRLPEDLHAAWMDGILASYVDQDPIAATQLVLSLPEGATRDRSIGAVVATSLGYGESVDVSLLDSVGSPAARDDVVSNLFPYFRAANADSLERMIPYISDEALTADFEARLEMIQ